MQILCLSGSPDHGDAPPGRGEVYLHGGLIWTVCMILDLVGAFDALHHPTHHVLCQIHQIIIVSIRLHHKTWRTERSKQNLWSVLGSPRTGGRSDQEGSAQVRGKSRTDRSTCLRRSTDRVTIKNYCLTWCHHLDRLHLSKSSAPPFRIPAVKQLGMACTSAVGVNPCSWNMLHHFKSNCKGV